MDKLREAIMDFRYLLSRRYPRENALKFVGDRYLLRKHERLLLYRCVYGEKEAEEHRRKLVAIKQARHARVAVDGYNTLITVESMLQNKPLILCDDSFIRDISSVHNKYKMTLTTEKALKLLAQAIQRNGIGEVKFFFDAQISRSGNLASKVRKLLKKSGVNGDSVAVKQADRDVLSWSGIAASSDALIINRSKKAIDLAGEILRMNDNRKIMKLP